MAQHDSHEETNDVRDRVVIPILLPVVALIITVALIVAIGEFLLVFGHGHMIIVGQEIVPQVFAALGLALVFLIGFAIVAARWAPDDTSS